MQFKDNVTVTFTTTNQWILKCVDEGMQELFGKEAFCTGGLEGTHSLNSGHYYGRALDFRTRGLSPSSKQNLKKTVVSKLKRGAGRYVVLLETTHMHVQRQHDSF